MQFSASMLAPVTGSGAKAQANVASVLLALNKFGDIVGVSQPHRFAQYAAQLSHESMGFVYDAELWGKNGGTKAQKGYEDRADLGHSNKVDGEAHTFRGRTTIQITGRSNYRQFRDWVRNVLKLDCPDFEQNPDAVNQDPWEGLAPIWYWDTRGLNKFADAGNNEMITKRINGGLNGYGDRLERYSKIGLAIMGYGYNEADIKAFQELAASQGSYDGVIDGDDGPKTRAAIHVALVKLGSVPVAETKAAPVTEQVLVAPKNAEKKALNRVLGTLGGGSTLLLGFIPDDPYIKTGLILLAFVAIVVVVWRAESIARRIGNALNVFGFTDKDE